MTRRTLRPGIPVLLARCLARLLASLALLFPLSAAGPAWGQAGDAPAQEWPPAALPILPQFLLPYDSSLAEVVWTGGPHPFSKGGDLDGQYRYGEGSGLDFAAREGASFPVLAMASGDVVKAGCGYAGLGCIVAVHHDVGGSIIIYGHLQEDSLIEPGLHVEQGTVLAQAGASGGQSSVHLHVELRDGRECDARLHRQCGDIGWAGNPVGWERGLLFVDGYRITGYCVARNDDEAANCFELPSARFYAYDGAAFRGASTATEYDFWFSDVAETGRTRSARAVAVIDPSYRCPSRRNCESAAATDLMQFAGHGVFGAGGGPNLGDELVSTNRAASLPGSSVSPGSPAAGRPAQVAIQRGAQLALLDVATGRERSLAELADARDASTSLDLTWNADGSALAYATTNGAQAVVTVLELDAQGGGVARWDLLFAQAEPPLPAFDPLDPDLLYYAVPAADGSGALDLFDYSLSAGIEHWLHTLPSDLPCSGTKLLALAADRFILLETCGTGAGNSLLALEVNKRAGTFEATWLSGWVAGYPFLDPPAACAGNAPQILDAAWATETQALAFLLSPDCMDALDGSIANGPEEIAAFALAPDGSASDPNPLFAAGDLTGLDGWQPGGPLLYHTSNGALYLLGPQDEAPALIATNVWAAAMRPGGAAPPEGAVSSATFAAADLTPTAAVSASSALPSDKYGDYGPAQAVDDSLATAWAEGADGPGVGEYLQFDFPAPIAIEYLVISPGYDSSDADFRANNRVAAAVLELDDGRRIPVQIEDRRGLQRIEAPAGVEGTATRSLRFTVDAAYPGDQFDDTCIAELQVWGTVLVE